MAVIAMMKMIYGRILVVLCISFFTVVCTANDLIIVSKDQKASIVISSKATAIERYAAEELQRSIRLMSGVELAILTENTNAVGSQIIIGTPGTNKNVSGDQVKLGLTATGDDEQIAVFRDGNTLYLAGSNPRSALYAVYTFLDSALGARWFWPGDEGEYLPKHSSISIGELNINETPSIKIRSLAITDTRNGDPDTDTWMARNRMNVVSVPAGTGAKDEKSKLRRQKGFLTRIAGHNIVLPDSLLKMHPEYIAETGGIRELQPGIAKQLCWSNPGVQTEVANMIAGWWNKNPLVDIVHFYPADNQRYCKCEQCLAMGDVSTRWQKFSDIVIAKVEQTHPGKRYWSYAYQGYKDVPKTKPNSFEFIGYTLYDASYRHLLSSGNASSKAPLDEINGWLKHGVNLGIRGYEYIIYKEPMFVPLVSWVNDQMKWLQKGKMNGYMSELPPYGYPKNALPENTYWNGARMALYAAARSMWNTNLSADGIVKEWNTTIYGPAAGDMIKYYNEIEHAWKNASKDISLYKHAAALDVEHFLSPALFENLFFHFSAARDKIKSLPPSVRNEIEKQISLESKMLGNWQWIYNLKKGRGTRYKLDIVKQRHDKKSSVEYLTTLPRFENTNNKIAADQTNVSLSWNQHDLVLQVKSGVKNIGNRDATVLTHDGEVWKDDCIQIFIQPDQHKPLMMRLAFNSKGTKYDATSFGGMVYDKTWDPKWVTKTAITANGWEANVTIPFSVLQLVPGDKKQFRMAVKRHTKNGSEVSGWPDAFNENPENLALVTLLNEPGKPLPKIVLFDAGLDGTPLFVEFQQSGWNAERDASNEKELKQLLLQNPLILSIRYSAKEFELSSSFMSKEVKEFVLNGGTLILAATGEIPVDDWFNLPAVKWSGTKYSPIRRSAFVLEDEWLKKPNDISTILNKGVTPTSGYQTGESGWSTLAKMKMQDGTEQSFLLIKTLGKGQVVLTSAAMGYSSGYEMFGNRNISNVVQLVENLQANFGK